MWVYSKYLLRKFYLQFRKNVQYTNLFALPATAYQMRGNATIIQTAWTDQMNTIVVRGRLKPRRTVKHDTSNVILAWKVTKPSSREIIGMITLQTRRTNSKKGWINYSCHLGRFVFRLVKIQNYLLIIPVFLSGYK